MQQNSNAVLRNKFLCWIGSVALPLPRCDSYLSQLIPAHCNITTTCFLTNMLKLDANMKGTSRRICTITRSCMQAQGNIILLWQTCADRTEMLSNICTCATHDGREVTTLISTHGMDKHKNLHVHMWMLTATRVDSICRFTQYLLVVKQKT